MKEKLIEQQWVDIVVPMAPDANYFLCWLLAVIVMLAAALAYYFLWHRNTRQRLIRKLRHLYKHTALTTEPKHILHCLECALCRFHVIPYLKATNQTGQHWAPLFTAITQQRYQKSQPSREQTEQLLQQSLQLLSHKLNEHAR